MRGNSDDGCETCPHITEKLHSLTIKIREMVERGASLYCVQKYIEGEWIKSTSGISRNGNPL
jgi:hypothetical protein